MNRNNRPQPGPRARLALVFAGLLGLTAWPGCSSTTPEPDASRATAAKFLDEIRAGKVSSAWESTTTEFKSLLGREGLEGYVRAHPALKEKEPADFLSFNTAERGDLQLGECAFRSASRKSAIKVLVARENGVWKVERLTVD